MDSKVARRIERLLALGYAEAARRKKSAVARLDALAEITAAVCDLLAPPRPKDSFYLSHVDVLHDGKLAASTLAEFDKDIAGLLPDARRTVELFRPWQISIPEHAVAQAGQALVSFWNEAIGSLCLSPNRPQGARIQAIPKDVASEFHATLRYAFDTIVEEDATNAFTLRVDPRGKEYKLTNEHRSSFLLGYCLPSSRLDDVTSKLAEAEIPQLSGTSSTEKLSLLETLLEPADKTQPFRSQSHTNVATRMAGLVLGQMHRSALLARPAAYTGPRDTTIPLEVMIALEQAVWGEVPDSIFMMPLTNDDFVGVADSPRALAHWYRVLSVDRFDIESLIAGHYRASMLFSEVLYQRYCKALGSALAAGILDGLSAAELTGGLGWIASAYGVADAYRVEVLPAESTSLLSRFKRLCACGATSHGSSWGQECEARLQRLNLKFNLLRHTHETDVLLSVMRRLEFEQGRRESGARLAREELLAELDRLHKSATEVLAIEDRVRERLGYPEAPFTTVIKLQTPLFIADEVECFADCTAILVLNNIMCCPAHGTTHFNESITCPDCLAEEDRRVKVLFNGRTDVAAAKATACEAIKLDLDDERAMQAFRNFVMNGGITPWEWLKQSCSEARSSRTDPSVACLVSLLFNRHAEVVWTDALESKWDYRIQGAPSRWTVGLSAIAKLSLESREGKGTVSVDEITETEITFGMAAPELDASWLLQRIKQAQKTDVDRGHSGARNVAAAYTVTSGRLPEVDGDAFLHGVRLRASDGRIACTWKQIVP